MKKHKTQTATTKREPISRKLRFDVFNRDHFKCKYCGQSAPDVVLHVDHVKPVAKGGTNEITNLATACSACNSGKSDTELVPVTEKQNVVYEPLIQEMMDQTEWILDDITKNETMFTYIYKIMLLFYVSDYENPLVKSMCYIIDANDVNIIDQRDSYDDGVRSVTGGE